MTRITGNASWGPLHSHPNKGIWTSPSRHLELNLWIQEMSSKQHGTIKHMESSKEFGTNQCLELKISFVMHAHDYKLTFERVTSISIRTKKLEKTHLSLVGSLGIISDINFDNILISQSSILPFPDQGCIPLTAAQLHEKSFWLLKLYPDLNTIHSTSRTVYYYCKVYSCVITGFKTSLKIWSPN